MSAPFLIVVVIPEGHLRIGKKGLSFSLVGIRVFLSVLEVLPVADELCFIHMVFFDFRGVGGLAGLIVDLVDDALFFGQAFHGFFKPIPFSIPLWLKR